MTHTSNSHCPSTRTALVLWSITALLGASAVLLEAYFSHGLSDQTDPKILNSLATAVRYQSMNSLVMALALVLAANNLWRWRYLPASGFAVATFAFSGGIYAKHLLGITTGSLTPMGGILMAFSWLLLARLGWLSGVEWNK